MSDATVTAFEALALPHLDAVYRTALALCRNQDQARDLAQSTFAKALGSMAKFQRGTSFKAWLLSILRNTWIDRLRHDQVLKMTQLTQEMDVEDASGPGPVAWTNPAEVLESFSDQQVIDALGELGDEQRLTLFLVDVEGLGMEEVATIMGVPIGTIKSRTSRARALLREKLAVHAKDLGFPRRER